MEKEKFEPGIYDISNERYHASAGISRSSLWAFKHLPQKYWYQYLSGEYERPADTEAFLIGNMFHTLVLEPKLFPERYFVMPKVNRTTKVGKAQYEENLALANGRALVNEEQMELIYGMQAALDQHSVVEDILSGNVKCEQSIFWTDEETGVACKARPDIWNSPIVADLKTTLDASYRGFQMAAMKDGYFLQAGMIYEALKSVGMPFEKFIFLCVEKKKPYAVGLYLLDQEALQFGIDLFHQLLRKYAECLYNESWPDYGIQMLMIPKYATMELENEGL